MHAFCNCMFSFNAEYSPHFYRIHGRKFAEMPFIGTRERFRGRRMLQTLLAQIESVSAGALSYYPASTVSHCPFHCAEKPSA